MSSTKRGSTSRDRLDRYYTPDPLAAVCVALLKQHHRLDDMAVLEAGVGGGAFARPLRAEGAIVTGIDLDFMAAGFDECNIAIVGSFIHLGDQLAHAFTSDRFDLVVGNPPYMHAEAFVRRGLDVAPVVAFLVRIAFIGSRGRYQRLWGPHGAGGLRYFYPFVERPSFTEDGKTDSADYAFYIIERGYTGNFSGRPVSWKP